MNTKENTRWLSCFYYALGRNDQKFSNGEQRVVVASIFADRFVNGAYQSLSPAQLHALYELMEKEANGNL